MAITIRVGDKPPEKLELKQIVKLQISKNLNDDFMIFDHSDIVIIINSKKKKVIAFPKDVMSNYVYGAQNRLFHFLATNGLVDPATVQGGNVYGSIEGDYYDSDKYSTVKLLILNVSKFIDEERPYFEFTENYDELIEDGMTDPDDEHSTKLGEIPQDPKKGSMSSNQFSYGNSFYYQSFTYE
tara:strand:+ start:885 stop:1433 length:549 start_codon:yes stop_codon:yes gene_type:complete